jgi:hypothetical protein
LRRASRTWLIVEFTDFGFWFPRLTPAFDVYCDDIVLDTKRIGFL